MNNNDLGIWAANPKALLEAYEMEQRRATRLASENDRLQEEIHRLVQVSNDFKDQLARVTAEKNDIVKLTNSLAYDCDELRAEYEARGKVIKKLRKKLHKAKRRAKK